MTERPATCTDLCSGDRATSMMFSLIICYPRNRSARYLCYLSRQPNRIWNGGLFVESVLAPLISEIRRL